MLTGSSEEKDLPKDSVSQRRTLWGKMDPLDCVPERQPSWAPAGLSARLPLAASEPCGRWKVCSIWPCLWSTGTLFADGIASVSKALFALPHGRVHVVCCHKPWSSGIAGLMRYVSNSFYLSSVSKGADSVPKGTKQSNKLRNYLLI